VPGSYLPTLPETNLSVTGGGCELRPCRLILRVPPAPTHDSFLYELLVAPEEPVPVPQVVPSLTQRHRIKGRAPTPAPGGLPPALTVYFQACIGLVFKTA
jgi:hypothetical protein